MGFGGRLIAMLVTLAATVAGTALVTLPPEAVAAETAAEGTVTIRVVAFEDDLDIRVWRRDGDDVVPVTGFVEESTGWRLGWHRLSGLPQGVELTLSAAPDDFRRFYVPQDVETFLGRQPSAETADWFTIDETSGFIRLPDLRLVEPTTVVGVLTDLEGRPWSRHSPVRVRSWIRTPTGIVRGPVGRTDPSRVEPGSFVVSGLWPGADVAVGIDPDVAPVSSAAFAGGGSSVEEARFVTTRAGKSVPVGTIRAPMEAAWVTGRAVDDDGIAYRGVEVVGQLTHAERPGYESSWPQAFARTDDEGTWGTHVLWGDEARFRLSVQQPGESDPTTVWIGGTSYGNARVFAPRGEARLEAGTVSFDRDGVVLRGRVFDDLGRPIGQTRVTVDVGDIRQYAVTDEQGAFEVARLPMREDQTVTVTEGWTGRTAAFEGVDVDRPLVELPDVELPTPFPLVTARVVNDDPSTDLSWVSLVKLPDEGAEWDPARASTFDLRTRIPAGTYGLFVERIPTGNYSWSDTVGWWWGGRRPGTGDPFTVTIAEGDAGTIDLGEVHAPPLTTLTGTVRDSDGTGLSATAVTVSTEYGHRVQPSERTVVTNDAGEYSILVSAGSGVQMSVEREMPGATYEPATRGTRAQPLVVDGATQTEDFVLTPVWAPTVGVVAGVRDEACLQKTAQQARRELELATVNGVLGWAVRYEDESRLGDWMDPAEPVVAIAPLMGMPSNMSWGRATDGSLCFLSVTDDVTHQTWISPPAADGRSDVTVNYDHVSTSLPRAGRDRPVITAGWSDGRSVVVLPGAGDEGDYDDGGRYALIRGSRGSSQPGRYRFRHVGFPTGLSVENVVPPTIQGELRPGETVRVDPGVWTADGRVVDDMVFTYQWSGVTSSSGPTRLLTHADGGHEVEVMVKAWYQGMIFTDRARARVAVEESSGPDPIVVTTSHGTTYFGVPIVWNTEAQLIVVHGCADVADPRFTVRFGNDTPDLTGPMTVGPTGEDGLRDHFISIPELPTTGVGASIVTNVPEACVPGSPLISTTIYIDPAGTLVDQYGVPLDHATATLFRAETEHGDYTRVPAGSEVMSEGNRENPVSTYGGAFRWDVVPGWYKVRGSEDSCEHGWSVPMAVPPARVAVLVRLRCGLRSLPVVPTGDGDREGDTLTATPASDLAMPDTVVTTQWFRGGQAIPGATGPSYTLGPYDVGRFVYARVTAQRAPYTPDDGRGRAFTFDPVVGSVDWEVPGDPIPLPPPPPTPSPVPTTPAPQAPAPTTPATARAASTTALRVVGAPSRSGHARARVRVTTSDGSVPTGPVEIRLKGRVVGRATLEVGDGGRVVVRLRQVRTPGRQRVVAVYLGSSTVLPSSSPRVRLRA